MSTYGRIYEEAWVEAIARDAELWNALTGGWPLYRPPCRMCGEDRRPQVVSYVGDEVESYGASICVRCISRDYAMGCSEDEPDMFSPRTPMPWGGYVETVIPGVFS